MSLAMLIADRSVLRLSESCLRTHGRKQIWILRPRQIVVLPLGTAPESAPETIVGTFVEKYFSIYKTFEIDIYTLETCIVRILFFVQCKP